MKFLNGAAATVMAGAFALMSSVSANAVTMYSDKAAWLAAAGGSAIETNSDPRPLFSNVNSITLLDGTTLGLSSNATLVQIGNGWATWCCGYTGNVYNGNGVSSIASAISSVSAFGFYMEPNIFSTFTMTLTTSDNSVLSYPVSGVGGAGFFGWVGSGVTSFQMSADPNAFGFAFGDFFDVQSRAVPEPATLSLIGAGVAAAGALRRRKRA